MLELFKHVDVKGVSHITGGGFFENIPRSIPDGLCAHICKRDVRILPIFDIIKREGKIPDRDMFNTFNMGVGMTVTVSRVHADKAIDILQSCGINAYTIGEITRDDEKIRLV